MKRRFGAIVLVLGVLCGTCAWAQVDTSTPDSGVPTQAGPKPAYTYPDATPSLDFLSQATENSKITLGIGAGFSYDSNAYSATSQAQSFWLFHVAPSISIQQFRPKLSWNVGYSGGYQTYTYTQQIGSVNSNNNLFSQQAHGRVLWQFARHWQLAASDGFSYSANPFDSYLTTPGTPTMNNPNPVTYYPLSQYTQNSALLTLTDQLSKTDTLTFTGTTNLRNTSTYNLLTSVPFYNLTSYGGIGAYSHRLSPRLSLGASYTYNSLDFGHGYQRSGVQSISMTVEYLVRPNMTVTAWFGPQYTSTKSVVSVQNPNPPGQIVSATYYDSLWSTSFGGTFGWQGRRNSMRATFSRSVLDGGGVIATSQVVSVGGTYRRMLSRKMNATAGVQYFHDVSTTVSSRSFDNLNFNAGLSYKLMKSLSASALYRRVHQTQSNTILIGPSTYNGNIVGVTVNYTWDHPLGR